ncbi:hypothetical protein NZ028_23505, partial [Escherichia coli]|nr:hypothetical protein [Escherichia coli]MCS7428871.1 hypothetical protein [Escherichia coli]
VLNKTGPQSIHILRGVRQQQDEPGRFSICSRQAAVVLTHAMKVVYQASQAVGIHGMFVEALNDNAKKFYLRLGFIQLKEENCDSLFYPTKSIEVLFEVNDE